MEPYRQLEQDIAAWAQVDNVVACSSGTAALHLALEAMGLPSESVVVVPEYTMIACARAVVLAGLRPLFVDVCEDDLTLDPDALDWTLATYAGDTPIRAVMPVHIYGRQCRMGAIADLAARYKLAIIEDSAEAHGIVPDEDSDAVCWSFYKNKIVAGEEGGAVSFADAELAERARSLRCLGFTQHHDYMHNPRGHNYRLANLLAEPVLKSLRGYEENVRLRREIEAWYDWYCPLNWRQPPRDAPWMYDLRIPGLTRAQQDDLVSKLNCEGIEARHGFKPMSWQQEFAAHAGSVLVDPHSRLPWQAAEASWEVICLPIVPATVSLKAGIQLPTTDPLRKPTTEDEVRRTLTLMQMIL